MGRGFGPRFEAKARPERAGGILANATRPAEFLYDNMMIHATVVHAAHLFGAKKLPELARGMGRAVKEFSAARDEVERELSQPGSKARKSEVLDAKAVLPSAR